MAAKAPEREGNPRLPTPENLSTIVVLYRAPDSLTLYGIPYKLREGQSPRHILEKYRSDWIYLGEPGWFQGTTDEANMVEDWLEPHHSSGVVPEDPYAWSYIGDALPNLGYSSIKRKLLK